MNHLNLPKYIAAIIIASLILGCAGPAKYDFAKYGSINKLTILSNDEQAIEYWADIDLSSNQYSRAGANDYKAKQFKELYSPQLKEFHTNLVNSIQNELQSKNIETPFVATPLKTNGKPVSYTSIAPPILECKVLIGFVRVKGGIMPTTTIAYRILETDGSSRLEKHVSIGYSKPNAWIEADLIGFPKKLYPDEQYILSHPTEIANDLLERTNTLGQAVAVSIEQNTRKP